MKKLFKIIAMALALIIVAAPEAAVIIEDVPVDQVYSPEGYKSNDDAEVVIRGYLPDLCYKSPQAKVAIEGKRIDISLQAYREIGENVVCAEMLSNFLKPVPVGVLDKGNYEIFVNGKLQPNLKIGEFDSDAIDDRVLANVHNAVADSEMKIVKLQGYNPSDCYSLDEVEIISNGSNSYSILPRMNKLNDYCPMKMVPFEIEVQVPEELESEYILLHVRSMYGKSVNALIRN
ncbi:hypothetical protein [Halobacteriovorax sp. HLS]|uniref:hypothetical protein n=1 Tax=Halobacteriovorax sp. HLS TaxID=2234000 RepID=UPI000FDB546F|nr:hypothetical protein [Halobacteriovorax sp. HLS]